MLRVPGLLLSAIALSLSVVVVAQAPPLRRLTLPPDASYPEGIAYSESEDAFYTASAETGALVRINRADGSSRVLVPPGVLMPVGTPTFPVALGMKIDGANRLWIAGGRSGRIFVVDLTSGKLVRQAVVPTPSGSLINDVAIVGGAAYFTDTRAPMMWRMTAGSTIGQLEPWLSFADTPVQYDGGNNLNGIVAAPDGQSLVVVQMDKGLLFRIDIAVKAVAPIHTGNADLSGGDGLVLAGSTLYVVRQPAGEIVTLQLGFRTAQVVSRFRDPSLQWPATAVLVGEDLVVVNSQFNTRATKSARLPFTLLAVPVVRLAGQ